MLRVIRKPGRRPVTVRTVGTASKITIAAKAIKRPAKKEDETMVLVDLVDRRFEQPDGRKLRIQKVCAETKGQFGGACNVTACQLPESAWFFNWGTSKYYCYHCVKEIGEVNNPSDRSLIKDERGNRRIVDLDFIDEIRAASFKSELHGAVALSKSTLKDRADSFIAIGNPWHL